MAHELTREHAKELYDLALNARKTGHFVHAIRVLEKLIEIGDPFYTPFALAIMLECYNILGQRELEMEVYKRVTRLPGEQQLLLNPTWLALCYQKSGDLKTARTIHGEILELTPNDPNTVAAFAEISLLQGNFDEAETWARKLRERAEVNYQILGRIILAFALALRSRHDESASELRWVGQFLISSGNIPTGAWDYRDLQPLAGELGANSPTAILLLDALTGRKILPQFIEAWNNIAPAA